MVKIKGTSRATTKLPILLMLQAIIIAVVVCYLPFVIRGITTNGENNNNNSNNNVLTGTEPPQAVRKILSIDKNEGVTKETASVQGIESRDTGSIVPVIGYAVSVTGCGDDPLVEGAAVLKHSIHLTSIHGNMGGKYDYKMYAIYHPNAKPCSMPLAELGYELLERNTPVAVLDIEGDFLRSKIEKNGCCGEKELIKLEAYTLTDHPVVVHLDLDVLILQPLDSLVDTIIQGERSSQAKNIKVQWPDKPIPDRVNAFFTRDYNMARPGAKHSPMQGGFLVVRPDLDVYKEFVGIVKKGDFQQGAGWGDGVGAWYGGMTIQGIIPYYYDILYPDTFVELNHCEWNQMCINPRDKPTKNDIVDGRCRTGEADCPDCRSLPVEQVKTTHYTLCQKPWWCLPHDADKIQERLCRSLLHEWYRVRSDLEKSWGRTGMGPGDWKQTDHFFGYCKQSGKHGYIPIAKPYGGVAVYT